MIQHCGRTRSYVFNEGYIFDGLMLIFFSKFMSFQYMLIIKVFDLLVKTRLMYQPSTDYGLLNTKYRKYKVFVF